MEKVVRSYSQVRTYCRNTLTPDRTKQRMRVLPLSYAKHWRTCKPQYAKTLTSRVVNLSIFWKAEFPIPSSHLLKSSCLISQGWYIVRTLSASFFNGLSVMNAWMAFLNCRGSYNLDLGVQEIPGWHLEYNALSRYCIVWPVVHSFLSTKSWWLIEALIIITSSIALSLIMSMPEADSLSFDFWVNHWDWPTGFRHFASTPYVRVCLDLLFSAHWTL